MSESNDVQATPCESGACIQVDEYGDAIRVRSGETGTAMQCTRPEWFAFLADIQQGKWAHIGHLPTEVPA